MQSISACRCAPCNFGVAFLLLIEHAAFQRRFLRGEVIAGGDDDKAIPLKPSPLPRTASSLAVLAYLQQLSGA